MYIFLLIIASILIILTLLQSGKSDGINGAFSGQQGLGLFSEVKKEVLKKPFLELLCLSVLLSLW